MVTADCEETDESNSSDRKIWTLQAHRVAVENIKDIETKITMEHGGGGTPYYEIRLVSGVGRPLVVGRYIRNKRELDWLVGEIRDGLGASV